MVDEVRFELEEWVESPAALERMERDLQDHARFNSSHDGVTFSPKTLAAKIVEQCEEVVQRHEDAPVAEYVDDEDEDEDEEQQEKKNNNSKRMDLKEAILRAFSDAPYDDTVYPRIQKKVLTF
jgi:hypothetical protein